MAELVERSRLGDLEGNPDQRSRQGNRRAERCVPPRTQGPASPNLVERVCRGLPGLLVPRGSPLPTPPTPYLAGRLPHDSTRPALLVERDLLPIDGHPCKPPRLPQPPRLDLPK